MTTATPVKVEPQAISGFDYSNYSADLTSGLRAAAGAIASEAKNMAVGAFKIGEYLLWVQNRLPYGEFGKWIEKECSYSWPTANRHMNVAKYVRNCFPDEYAQIVHREESENHSHFVPIDPAPVVDRLAQYSIGSINAIVRYEDPAVAKQAAKEAEQGKPVDRKRVRQLVDEANGTPAQLNAAPARKPDPPFAQAAAPVAPATPHTH